MSGVVLDIGGDVGAVVVLLGDHEVDDEIDIQPVGDAAGRFHTGVHDRALDGAVVRTAIFPEVRGGTYELLDRDHAPFAVVDAAGGEVRTYDLRSVS
jgi:hypothetical protein